MEQIYYTQCPIGYGLGASNGYQIKRISAGYPVAGDFRHLGLKAFPGGGRTLAPAVLRYRRDDDHAEVARLTPRPQEYQTERGFWGRPGGVFAHGLRLDAAELGLFGNWPAAWFDAPSWQTADPEPTRGRPPEDLDLTKLGSFRLPNLSAVTALRAGEDVGWLAQVWTALAQVTREGRTLFLIDEPDRLARLVALLTGALPAALRGDLTFSTFHDRPEELPGYRLQGTSPVVRPNRLALLSQGVIADRLAWTVEPAVEPAAWATTLAGWVVRHEAIDEADWAATETRAAAARKPGDPLDLTWSDAWLDPLVGFPAAYRDRTCPASTAGWERLRHLARWSGRAGSGDEWLRHRGPGWWLEQIQDQGGTVATDPAARAALLAHARLRDAWRNHEQARGWGAAVAAWFAPSDQAERDEAVEKLFAAAPKAARPSFAQALFRHLAPEPGAATLERLQTNPTADRATLLPLKAGILAGLLVKEDQQAEANDPFRREVAEATANLRRVLTDAASFPGATAGALDAVAGIAHDQPGTLPLLAGAVAPAFDQAAASESLAWALRQDGAAAAWLAPALRPRLADIGQGSLFGTLRAQVDADLHPKLARAVVAVADDPGLPDDAFRLAVERLVLPLAPRPHDPTWGETYLRRTPLTYDLYWRLYSKDAASLGLRPWINQCRARGEISTVEVDRLDSLHLYARSLSSGDPRSLVETPIPTGSPTDRAPFFRQMLSRFGSDRVVGLPMVLDACHAAWPGAFAPGSPGLASLARPLAERLAPGPIKPADWLPQVVAVLDRLDLTAAGGGFEPDGLFAEVVAALPTPSEVNPWPLRQFLYEDVRAWPALQAILRADLEQLPAVEAPTLVKGWDDKISKPRSAPAARFWELVLNAADPARLATIIPARIKDLQSLGLLRWWDHAAVAGSSGDLRDAYARTVPLDPLPTGRLADVERWLTTSSLRPTNLDDPIAVDEEDEVATLSEVGRERWLCLKALTEYGPNSTGPSSSREASYQTWQASLPVDVLLPEERYRWMAWMILGVDPTDPPLAERLAAFLERLGVLDAKRVSRWVEELPIAIPAQTQMDRAGFVGNLGREVRTLAEANREARRRETR